eukprot:GHVN01091063.1.p1 GENE.GHVN01091063.1~~GHVN01091063.1.p1  ORF type:complete len:251 (-),score=44.18 GHVN01091063.1:279-1031(-)
METTHHNGNYIKEDAASSSFVLVGNEILKRIEINDGFEKLTAEHVDEGIIDGMRILGEEDGMLTKSIAMNQSILFASDKAGLSAVVDVAIPVGSIFKAAVSTWCNPQHGKFEIEPTQVFGVGVIPFGTCTNEEWVREGFKTSIKNGIQYNSEVNFRGMMFGEGPIVSQYQVLQDGKEKYKDTKTRPPLSPFDIEIIREDKDGTTIININKSDNNNRIIFKYEKDLQLYLNCLSWADNFTYVRFEKISLEQ